MKIHHYKHINQIQITGYYSADYSTCYVGDFIDSNCILDDAYFGFASRSLRVYNNECSAGLVTLNNGLLNHSEIFNIKSDGTLGDVDASYTVIPVVTLKSGIQMTKDENDVWQLARGQN